MDRILNTSDKRAPRTGEILAVGARAACRAGVACGVRAAAGDGPGARWAVSSS